jgi:NodT family efflux transporter outer membrane factor (OMF) lipoprotein
MSRSAARSSLAYVRLASICALSAAGACTVGPDYEKPETPMRERYLESAAEPGVARAQPWWLEAQDLTLNDLIRDAASHSYDLRIVAARVDEAIALRGGVASRQFPHVDATASVRHQRDSENGSFPIDSSAYRQFLIGLESSWEVDIWGRVRREVEAATADVEAAHELYLDAVRIVIAQIGAAYFDLRGAERELEVTRRNIEAQRGIVELTERLSAEGLGTDADVARARGLLRETEAAVPLLEARVAGNVHALAVLSGGDAADIRRRVVESKPAKILPTAPPLGIPSELLKARPDIRAAERELHAATARIGVATADLYPRVSLTGRFGFESTEGKSLFDAGSMSFGIGPALRWPLLDFGFVRSQIEAQGARQRGVLARYEQVVAQALTEVESSLASLQSRARNRASLAQAVDESRESLRLIDFRFREGATSFLDVLDAQRRLFLVEAELARAETQMLLDFVALSRALG